MSKHSGRFRRGIIAGVLGLLGLALHGCGQADAEPANQPPTVRLGYFANLTHAQAVLGVQSGEFERAIAPARLDTKLFNAGPALVEALLAGEIDVAYVGPGPAIAAYGATHGKGLRVISGAAANGVGIVARPGAGIRTLTDLRGKRVATPQMANTQDIAARHYFRTTLNVSDLSGILPIPNAEQLGMMQSGQIDAAWVPEPWASRLIVEAQAELIAEEKELWPGEMFATTLVVATPEFIETHPELVEKLLKVHRDWTARLNGDPAGSLGQLKPALYALTRKSLPAGVLEQAIERVRFTDDPASESIEQMALWSYELSFTKRRPELSDLIDRRFAAKGE